jgi:hypothetical protein
MVHHSDDHTKGIRSGRSAPSLLPILRAGYFDSEGREEALSCCWDGHLHHLYRGPARNCAVFDESPRGARTALGGDRRRRGFRGAGNNPPLRGEKIGEGRRIRAWLRLNRTRRQHHGRGDPRQVGRQHAVVLPMAGSPGATRTARPSSSRGEVAAWPNAAPRDRDLNRTVFPYPIMVH